MRLKLKDARWLSHVAITVALLFSKTSGNENDLHWTQYQTVANEERTGPTRTMRDCSCDILCWWTGSCCENFATRCLRDGWVGSTTRSRPVHASRVRRMAFVGNELDSNFSGNGSAVECLERDALTVDELNAAMSFVFMNTSMEILRDAKWRSNFTELLQEIWQEQLFLSDVDMGAAGNFCAIPATPVLFEDENLVEMSFYIRGESSTVRAPWLASVLGRVRSIRSQLETRLNVEISDVRSTASSNVWNASGMRWPTAEPPTASVTTELYQPADISTGLLSWEFPALGAVAALTLILFCVCQQHQKATKRKMMDFDGLPNPTHGHSRHPQYQENDALEFEAPAISIIHDHPPRQQTVLVNHAAAQGHPELSNDALSSPQITGPVSISTATTKL